MLFKERRIVIFIKRGFDSKAEMCKTFFGNSQDRLVLRTLILETGLGLGGGLIISAFVKYP